jgi:hypothetical protein
MSNQYFSAYCPRCGKQKIKICGGEDLGQGVRVGHTITCENENCDLVKQVSLTDNLVSLTDKPKEKKPKRSSGFEFL